MKIRNLRLETKEQRSRETRRQLKVAEQGRMSIAAVLVDNPMRLKYSLKYSCICRYPPIHISQDFSCSLVSLLFSFLIPNPPLNS